MSAAPLPPVHIAVHDRTRKLRGDGTRWPIQHVELRLTVETAKGWHGVGTLTVTPLQYRWLFRPWLLNGARAAGVVVTIDETHAPSLRGAR